MSCDLDEIADWLQECRIDTVAMESTGVYWNPLFGLLIRQGIEVFLVNANHVRNVTGRKTDIGAAAWIQQLHIKVDCLSGDSLDRRLQPASACKLKILDCLREMSTPVGSLNLSKPRNSMLRDTVSTQ